MIQVDPLFGSFPLRLEESELRFSSPRLRGHKLLSVRDSKNLSDVQEAEPIEDIGSLLNPLELEELPGTHQQQQRLP